MSNENQCTYSVVYYARKNKVHKSKGVSKFDGMLTVRFPPLSTVSLKNTEESEDDSEDEDANASSKKRRKVQSISCAKGVVFSAAQRDIAKSAMEGSLKEDDIIVVGGYEVQIISCLSSLAALAKEGAPTTKGSVLGVTRPAKLSVSKSSLPLSNVTKITRKPPAQPQKVIKTQQHTMGMVKQSTTLQNGMRRPLLSTTNSQVVPKKTIPIKRPVPSTMKQPPSAAKSAIPDASVLPHIPLPSSIRRALKEHQIIAVDFLWKALTSLRGSILADEMGLGKTLTTIAIICAFYRQNRTKVSP